MRKRTASLLFRRWLGRFGGLVFTTDKIFFHEVEAGWNEKYREEGGREHAADDGCAEDLTAYGA